MSQIVLNGRKVYGGVTEGEALVTRQNISTWGGVHAVKGIITERRHELSGQSFKDKILVFPAAKGSSGWSTVAQVIRLADQSPKAMIIREISSLTGIGAVVHYGQGDVRRNEGGIHRGLDDQRIGDELAPREVPLLLFLLLLLGEGRGQEQCASQKAFDQCLPGAHEYIIYALCIACLD